MQTEHQPEVSGDSQGP